MRRNLDQSEAAIIQVFEEKQRVWERQMDELRQNYASRLQQVNSPHILILRKWLHFIFYFTHISSPDTVVESLPRGLMVYFWELWYAIHFYGKDRVGKFSHALRSTNQIATFPKYYVIFR